MRNRSIVDRVLLIAAAVCVTGLVWQLTVLMTSKGNPVASRKIEAVAAASARSLETPMPAAPSSPPIRVVYADGGSPKMTGKATDTLNAGPMALASPAVMNSISSDAGLSSTPASNTPAPVKPAPVEPSLTPLASASQAPGEADVSEDENAAAMPKPSVALTRSVTPPQVASLAPAPPAPPSETPAAPNDTKLASRQGLNINSASIEALNHLSGAGRIGQAIASHRPYRSVEDLLTKRVVRRSVYDQIKRQLAAE